MTTPLLHSYQNIDSWLHRLPAYIKLVSAVTAIIAITMIPKGQWLGICIALFIGSCIVISAKLQYRALLKRLLLLELFAIGIALLPLLQGQGIEFFLFNVVRISLCILCMLLVSSTTRFTDILSVLWRLHLPSILITTLALMYRYLFLLHEELSTLQKARNSRTFSTQKKMIWHLNATILAQLFIRTLERAERIYGAMKSRGWKN